MLICAAVADPRPVFAFRFNGDRIMMNSSKYTLVTNNTHGTLTVVNVQGSDEGTYTCSASNRYGSVTTAGVLSVQGMFRASQCLYRTIPMRNVSNVVHVTCMYLKVQTTCMSQACSIHATCM